MRTHSRDWVIAPVLRECVDGVCWISGTHTHTPLNTFCGIKIGVKRDTLICSVGHSPAGAGLYGLLGRRREGGGQWGNRRRNRISEGERNILFWEVKRDRKGPTL